MSSTTRFRKAISTGDLNTTTRSYRSYTLDRAKALDNKRQICNNEHINYAMKPGTIFVIEYSTAAYELAKTVTAQILQSNDFKENFAIDEQVGQDQTNAIVDLVYKIYNRKQNGQTGNQLKFAINMYHTQCKINVNGNRVDIFVNDIFDKICDKTKLNVQNLDIVNSTIASQISPLLPSSSNMVKKVYKIQMWRKKSCKSEMSSVE